MTTEELLRTILAVVPADQREAAQKSIRELISMALSDAASSISNLAQAQLASPPISVETLVHSGTIDEYKMVVPTRHGLRETTMIVTDRSRPWLNYIKPLDPEVAEEYEIVTLPLKFVLRKGSPRP